MAKQSKSYEGSAKDRREDKGEAKKRGMPMKDWEGSAADRRMDAAHSAPRGGKAAVKK